MFTDSAVQLRHLPVTVSGSRSQATCFNENFPMGIEHRLKRKKQRQEIKQARSRIQDNFSGKKIVEQV
jgi:hypothetical protein